MRLHDFRKDFTIVAIMVRYSDEYLVVELCGGLRRAFLGLLAVYVQQAQAAIPGLFLLYGRVNQIAPFLYVLL